MIKAIKNNTDNSKLIQNASCAMSQYLHEYCNLKMHRELCINWTNRVKMRLTRLRV